MKGTAYDNLRENIKKQWRNGWWWALLGVILLAGLFDVCAGETLSVSTPDPLEFIVMDSVYHDSVAKAKKRIDKAMKRWREAEDQCGTDFFGNRNTQPCYSSFFMLPAITACIPAIESYIKKDFAEKHNVDIELKWTNAFRLEIFKRKKMQFYSFLDTMYIRIEYLGDKLKLKLPEGPNKDIWQDTWYNCEYRPRGGYGIGYDYGKGLLRK